MLFAGVRFALFGFDSVSEAQYQSEIVQRGGVDIGRYDSTCTHVIVSGRLFDDPVCVAARNDGKTLVTELWVDDCLDFGELADATRVLYRPVKDLNGIPGSEALQLCLTGYQRQEREDIMKMASLMGAHFSKPLIANQVTHLICYKFEGEKYELAKKMNIKLVNHQWLEDCLKEWKILPIDGYTKSGWEVEILEAQAMDSEEETEDAGRSALQTRGSISSSRLQSQLPICSSSDGYVQMKDKLDICQDAVGNSQSHNAEHCMDDRSVVTPHRERSAGKAIDMSISNKFTGTLNHKSVGVLEQAGSDYLMANVKSNENASVSCDGVLKKEGGTAPSDEKSSPLSYSRKSSRMLVSAEVSVNLNAYRESASVSCDGALKKERGTASSDAHISRNSPTSAAVGEKSSPLSYSRKTPRMLVSAEHPADLTACHEVNLEGKMLMDNLDMLHLGPKASIINSESHGKSLAQGSEHRKESPTNALSLKRKSPLSSVGSKSPNTQNQDSEVHAPHSTSASSGLLQSVPALSLPPEAENNSSERAANSNSAANQHADPSKSKSLSDKKRSVKQAHPVKKSKLSVDTDTAGVDLADFPSNSKAAKMVDEIMNEKHNLPASETAVTCVAASFINGRTVPELPLAHDKLKIPELNIGIQNTSNYLDALVTDVRNSSGTVGKEKPVNDENVVKRRSAGRRIKDVELPQMRKQSGIGSSGTGKEDVTKASSKRVVVKKKLGCRTTLSSSKEQRSAAGLDIETPTSYNKIDVPNKSSDKLKKVAEIDEERDVVESDENEKPKKGQEVGKGIAYQKNATVQSLLKEDMMEEDPVEVSHGSLPDRNKTNLGKGRKGMSEKVLKDHAHLISRSNSKDLDLDPTENSMDSDKENKPKENGFLVNNLNNQSKQKVPGEQKKSAEITTIDNKNALQTTKCAGHVQSEPAWFLLSGHRLQRKEFHKVIRRLRGKLCRDSHQWSYQATHFIVPDPLRRTEKFFAAAASGRWILSTDYVTASNEAGKLLDEESFEWHRKGLTEDGAISLEAPRKWRLLRKRTGHGAFYGMHIIIYGECIAPSLDTLKHAIKAGDGTILATSPPYTRFLKSGVDYAIVSPSMSHVDVWVQEFLKHEVPCVLADYLVEYVCKPGYSLERHVLYKTHAWAEKSFANLLLRSEVVIDAPVSPEGKSDESDELCCAVCGSPDRAEVMLVCGNESGSVGCGIGTHIDCCDPPLNAVPEDDWICPRCTSKASETTRKGARKRSSRAK